MAVRYRKKFLKNKSQLKSKKIKIIVLFTFLALFLGAANIMYVSYVKNKPKKGYIISPRTEYDPIKVDSALRSQKGYKR
jgi:hypothetical protein